MTSYVLARDLRHQSIMIRQGGRAAAAAVRSFSAGGAGGKLGLEGLANKVKPPVPCETMRKNASMQHRSTSPSRASSSAWT